MADLQEIEERQNRRDHFEDEIELIDYLRILWKWKWLIIGGTLLCILAIAIYGFTSPVVKMYKVSALIEIDPRAKLDPPDKIKSMIEYGIYNQQVLKELSNLQGISNPESLAFEVAIPKGLNILDIAYRTPNPDLGKAVLNRLIEELKQEYEEKINRARYQFDETIRKKSESIKNIQTNIHQAKLVNDNKISGLNSKSKDIQTNIHQAKLVNDNKISGLNSKIKGIQASIEIIEKEFEKNKTTTENAVIRHKENIKKLRDNIRIVKNNIDEMKNVLQKAQSNSEKLAAQRGAIVLDPKNKAEYVDLFMQAGATQQIISHPVALTDKIRSLSFKEKEFQTGAVRLIPICCILFNNGYLMWCT